VAQHKMKRHLSTSLLESKAIFVPHREIFARKNFAKVFNRFVENYVETASSSPLSDCDSYVFTCLHNFGAKRRRQSAGHRFFVGGTNIFRCERNSKLSSETNSEKNSAASEMIYGS
jgi:hypothetical protein